MKKKKVQSHGGLNQKKNSQILKRMKKHWQIYLLILIPVIWYLIFCYYPMFGLQLAFKDYKANKGIWGSPWNDFKHFKTLMLDSAFWNSISMTIRLNLWKILLVFPAPIFLALMFNEARFKKGKRVMQTIFTFPNFLSWVVVAAIFKRILSVDGVVNQLITSLGGTSVSFLSKENLFWPILLGSDIWKGVGYSSIIYLATLNGIDQEMYEAADIDGAGRWARMRYITIPSIMPLVSVMLIMTFGNLMSAGFDQIFNMQNAAVKNMADVLDIFIYRITFETSPNFGFSVAVSLFRSVVNLALLLGADLVSKKLGGDGLIAKSGK